MENSVANLKAIDLSIAKKIKEKVDNYLSLNPKELGKQLSHYYKGLYSYRYCDYRIIYEVNDLQIVILILKVGHKKEVYDD